MTPRILVIVGTPIAGSLNHALAASYIDAARDRGADVRVVDLANDPIPGHPTNRDELRMPRTDADVQLDPDIAAYIEDVRWADHLVFFHPQWWGTYPAALKAFIDRVFLLGFSYDRRPRTALAEKLLAGRTARLVMTMDTPNFWNRLVYRNAAGTSLKQAILAYCGVKTTGMTRFTSVRFSEDEQRAGWIADTAKLGRRDAAASVSRDREAVTA
ncbi:NAD(P)H-dependent oxidoreductase [Microbacterium sp. B2969]|uniref:NAD(P)H-dependent oxidoreductase n=1 Tax=Microbacterium alkaliflavum TaxID=3248839 RepID=A0ABW7Q8X1_9MICO